MLHFHLFHPTYEKFIKSHASYFHCFVIFHGMAAMLSFMNFWTPFPKATVCWLDIQMCVAQSVKQANCGPIQLTVRWHFYLYILCSSRRSNWMSGIWNELCWKSSEIDFRDIVTYCSFQRISIWLHEW